jgi:hypothetical protein
MNCCSVPQTAGSEHAAFPKMLLAGVHPPASIPSIGSNAAAHLALVLRLARFRGTGTGPAVSSWGS